MSAGYLPPASAIRSRSSDSASKPKAGAGCVMWRSRLCGERGIRALTDRGRRPSLTT